MHVLGSSVPLLPALPSPPSLPAGSPSSKATRRCQQSSAGPTGPRFPAPCWGARPRKLGRELCLRLAGRAVVGTQPAATSSGGACANERGTRSIAIAVDDSPDSKYACRWALDNLVRPGDEVRLMHVIPIPMQGLYALPDGRMALLNMRKAEAYFDAAEEAVAAWARLIFEPPGVRCVVEVLREDPEGPGGKSAVASRLCARAGELGAAALVVASRTHSALAEAVVGSVASWCAHHSPATPVAVLHAPFQQQQERERAPAAAHHDAGGAGSTGAEGEPGVVSEGDVSADELNLIGQTVGVVPGGELRLPEGGHPAGAAAEGAKGARFPSPRPTPAGATEEESPRGRNILVCVDDSEASVRACAWAAAQLWAPGDTLRLLRVIPSVPRAVYGGGGLGSPDPYLLLVEQPTEAFKAAAEEFMERRFAAALRAAGVTHESEVVVEPVVDSVAGVGRAVCRRAEDLGAAAVVVGSHMRGGLAEAVLGSTASWMAHHCRVPVVVLH